MSPNRAPITTQFAPPRQPLSDDHGGMKKIALSLRAASLALALAGPGLAWSQAPAAAAPVAVGTGTAAAGAGAIDTAFSEQLQRLATDSAQAVLAEGTPPVRIAVELGQLDPRLKLAPCTEIQPYLPPGSRPLGRTRIGLRCLQGPTRWNVYLPVTVRLFAQAVVTTAPLPMGTVLQAGHFTLAEVDLAERADPAFTVTAPALGRTLARPMAAGETLRRNDLKPRQYFQAGDLVRIVAVGNGYAVSAEGQALNAGIEGQQARVRTESGRILSGLPAGDRRVEVPL
jgi:flagella basal body P-ring formation protein FlgA